MSININILSNFNGSGFDKLSRELDRLKTPMEKIGAVSKTLAPAAQIGLVALGGLAVGAIRAAEEAQVADNRLDSVARSMGLFGHSTDDVTDRLKAFADATSKKVAVDDELIKSTQAQLLTFEFLAKTAGTAGGAFDRATIAAFDMAAVFGGTGEDNAVRLGKALQDPISGVTALRRVGVQLSDQQEEMIEKAKEIVYDEYYDTWYDGLNDPYYFLVEEQGLYDADSFANANFVQIDYEKLGDDLEQDYTYIYHNGDLYVFGIR